MKAWRAMRTGFRWCQECEDEGEAASEVIPSIAQSVADLDQTVRQPDSQTAGGDRAAKEWEQGALHIIRSPPTQILITITQPESEKARA